MIQRGGQVVIRMFDNVRRKTIEPILRRTIAPGTLINTDEYGIYNVIGDNYSCRSATTTFAGRGRADGACDAASQEARWSRTLRSAC